MNSLPQDNNLSADSTQQPSNTSLNKVINSDNQLDTNTAIPLGGITSQNKNSNSLLDSNKLIVIGIVMFGIAIFFLVTRGNDFCIFSSCSEVGRNSATLTDDFWAFAGGTATVVVLSTFLGISLLPAVGIATAVWFFIYSSLHLS